MYARQMLVGCLVVFRMFHRSTDGGWNSQWWISQHSPPVSYTPCTDSLWFVKSPHGVNHCESRQLADVKFSPLIKKRSKIKVEDKMSDNMEPRRGIVLCSGFSVCTAPPSGWKKCDTVKHCMKYNNSFSFISFDDLFFVSLFPLRLFVPMILAVIFPTSGGMYTCSSQANKKNNNKRHAPSLSSPVLLVVRHYCFLFSSDIQLFFLFFFSVCGYFCYFNFRCLSVESARRAGVLFFKFCVLSFSFFISAGGLASTLVGSSGFMTSPAEVSWWLLSFFSCGLLLHPKSCFITLSSIHRGSHIKTLVRAGWLSCLSNGNTAAFQLHGSSLFYSVDQMRVCVLLEWRTRCRQQSVWEGLYMLI